MEKPTVLLKQRRDFSDVINATFSFISQEFKGYGRVFLYYAGIPILLTAIAGAFFSGTEITRVFSQMGSVDNSAEMLGTSYYAKLSIVYILSLIVYVFVSGLTAAYMHLYSIKGRSGFEASEVWSDFIRHVWRLTGFYLLLFIGFSIFAGSIGAILVGFSFVGSGITVFLSMLIFFVLMFYVSVPLSMGYIVIYAENRAFGELFKRVFELVKGKWWQTFGVIFILMLIYSIISSLFSIPVIISTAIQGFISTSGGEPFVGENLSFTMIVVSLISTLGQFIMYPIILIGIAFQYFNLREQKDNEGLLKKVSKMVEQ